MSESEKIAFTKYATSDYLNSVEDVAGYIEAVLEEDDPTLLLLALRNVADSKGGMAMISRQTGLSRESLYRSLSENGNPKISTLFSVIKALGLHLSVKAA
jgi:probable addiction module antidote protein